MRDHTLKIEVGAAEDKLTAVRRDVEAAANEAAKMDATAHAEFYGNVAVHLREAEAATVATVAAYTLLLNGDEDLLIEPLDDE